MWKTSDNFPPDGTVRMEKKLFRYGIKWNGSFLCYFLGNKPRISTRNMVRECDRGKWFSNIPVISVKTGNRGLHLKQFLFFRKIPIGKDCSICCPTRTTGFSIQKESAPSLYYISLACARVCKHKCVVTSKCVKRATPPVLGNIILASDSVHKRAKENIFPIRNSRTT